VVCGLAGSRARQRALQPHRDPPPHVQPGHSLRHPKAPQHEEARTLGYSRLPKAAVSPPAFWWGKKLWDTLL